MFRAIAFTVRFRTHLRFKTERDLSSSVRAHHALHPRPSARHRNGCEGGGMTMKRLILAALVLAAALAPFASNASADIKSDEAIIQAP